MRRRFEFELAKLRERIHILEGFEIVFDAIDEAIRIIRGSEGKRDAAEQLMARFTLDDLQTEAILELKLYKLAKLEILAIREELEEKRTEAARIEAILASDAELWSVVSQELSEIRKLYGEPRRTAIGGDDVIDTTTFSEADYIVSEKTYVIVTRDGWIKRQQSFTDIEKIRIREGDAIGWIGRAITKSTITFFGDQGSAYVLRSRSSVTSNSAMVSGWSASSSMTNARSPRSRPTDLQPLPKKMTTSRFPRHRTASL